MSFVAARSDLTQVVITDDRSHVILRGGVYVPRTFTLESCTRRLFSTTPCPDLPLIVSSLLLTTKHRPWTLPRASPFGA